MVLGFALNGLLFLSLSTGDWTWQNDFAAYYHAAEQMSAGSSPYAAEQLSGAYQPVGPEQYLYPPLFAQALAPVTLVPLEAAKVLWLIACFGSAFLATWLAAGIGGAPRGPDRTLWSMGGTVAGVAAGVGILLKVVPGALAPAALVESGRSMVALMLTITSLTAVGFVLAPGAWMDYPVVLMNMLAAGVDHGRNIAPDRVALGAGFAGPIPTLLRAAAIAGGLVCMLASVWAARRPRGMPLATLLGSVGMLLIPGTIWYHYLAVLLPFAAMAWPTAMTWIRSVLLIGGVLVAVGVVVGGGVALVGSGMILGAAAMGLWRWMASVDGSRLVAVEPGGDRRGA